MEVTSQSDLITSNFEKDYKDLLLRVLENGTAEKNRTGVDRITCFGESLKIDMSSGFLPIVTGKKIFYKKAYHEFIWFVRGMTTTTYLNKNNINWWDEYADAKGDLGKTYGYQLRNFNGHFDQLDNVCNELKRKSSRAHITLWNPSELGETSLPCCYTGFTFVVTGNGTVCNMSMQFRSSDLFLGLPYDIIVGAFLMRRVAAFCELKMGDFKLNLENAHIYENHEDQVKRYINSETFRLPNFTDSEDISYKHGPLIKAKLNN